MGRIFIPIRRLTDACSEIKNPVSKNNKNPNKSQKGIERRLEGKASEERAHD